MHLNELWSIRQTTPACFAALRQPWVTEKDGWMGFRVPGSRHAFSVGGCSAPKTRAVIKGCHENLPSAAKYQGETS